MSRVKMDKKPNNIESVRFLENIKKYCKLDSSKELIIYALVRPALRKLYRKLDGYVSLAFGCLIELAGLVAGISAATWTIRYVLSTPISFLLKLAILPTGTILSFTLCFVIPTWIGGLIKDKP